MNNLEYDVEFIWNPVGQYYTCELFPGLQIWVVAKDLVRVTWVECYWDPDKQAWIPMEPLSECHWEHDEQVWTGLELAGWIMGQLTEPG